MTTLAATTTDPFRRATNAQLARIESEFREMPGLQLTAAQARRLFNLDHQTCVFLLGVLMERGFLTRTFGGQYVRVRTY